MTAVAIGCSVTSLLVVEVRACPGVATTATTTTSRSGWNSTPQIRPRPEADPG